jgi:hypothetical protein
MKPTPTTAATNGTSNFIIGALDLFTPANAPSPRADNDALAG